MDLDIDKIRNDTPACKDKLFFNSAGSSLPPHCVNEAVISYLREEEQIGGYKLAELKQGIIHEFYIETARMLHCHPKNIAFTYNSTDAYARAVSSIPVRPGDTIITTDNDYISNYVAFISLQKHFGVEIIRIQNNSDGSLDLEDLENIIRSSRVAFVSVSHVPTNTGLIQDIEGVGKICHDLDIWYVVDACQSAGQIPLDVNKIKCDFLCSAGRKFLRGPRGTGLLYVSDKVLSRKLAPMFLDMRGGRWTDIESYELFDGARRFELWEFNYANVLGLKEAIRYGNTLGWENIYNYNQRLVSYARDQLRSIAGINQYDIGSQLANIITLRKEGIKLERMHSYLEENKVYFSVANVENALIDFKSKGIDWAIRLSPHLFNIPREIDDLCEILDTLK